MIQQDKIGREEIVDKICTLVDNLEKDKHFCLALNGEWGSGKSFVMQMIEDNLKTHSDYIIVKYDAWKNNFYSDPLIAILYSILDDLNLKCNFLNKKNYRLIKKVSKKIAGETITEAVNKAIDILLPIGNEATICAICVIFIKNIIANFNDSLLDNKLFDDFKSYQKVLNDCKLVLNTLTTKEIRDKNNKENVKFNKLIILVDEIDRCLPDEQLKVLERLHHLFDVENCAVIVAMNQKCIANTVKTIYGVDGNEYLRKFFDFNYTLEMSSATYLRSLLSELETSLTAINNKVYWKEPINAAFNCLVYGKKPIGKKDNREINRYFETSIKACNDFGWENLDKDTIFFILVALYVRRFLSAEFLNTEIIANNQKKIDMALQPSTSYNYIKTYFGLDYTNLSGNVTANVNADSMIKFINNFNDIVRYSVKKPVRQAIDPAICIKLRELVLLYGGDKVKDDKTANS